MSGDGKGAGGRERVRLKDARAHKPSSQTWLLRQLNDPYVKRAKQEGYRARSVFKLQEIDDRFQLVRRGIGVVDLGAAPGSWSQYCAKKGARVAAIDLQEMDPIAGVQILQGDFLDPAVDAPLRAMAGERIDLVLSDMAAASTGTKLVDRLRAEQLGDAVLAFSAQYLAPGGHLLIKLVRGAEAKLQKEAGQLFRSVRILRPDATRSDSSEVYLLGLERKDGVTGSAAATD